MKLTISLLAAAAVLRFTTPGPGSYSLLSWEDNFMTVVASGYCVEQSPNTVTVILPRDKVARIFSVRFEPRSEAIQR